MFGTNDFIDELMTKWFGCEVHEVAHIKDSNARQKIRWHKEKFH